LTPARSGRTVRDTHMNQLYYFPRPA